LKKFKHKRRTRQPAKILLPEIRSYAQEKEEFSFELFDPSCIKSFLRAMRLRGGSLNSVNITNHDIILTSDSTVKLVNPKQCSIGSVYGPSLSSQQNYVKIPLIEGLSSFQVILANGQTFVVQFFICNRLKVLSIQIGAIK